MTEQILKRDDEKFCKDCGSKIHINAEICPKCGVRQQSVAPVASASGLSQVVGEKNKLAAILFAIFLGSFGIHKFYLGSIGWGVVYLLFCWTFIPGLIGLIEGIIYATMTDQAFAAKYG